MNLIDRLSEDHLSLKKLTAALQLAAQTNSPSLDTSLTNLRTAIQSHFQKEEPLYRLLDDRKRTEDRGMMHQMRNDHAAVIFTLESLGIRLRKSGLTDEWNERLSTMLGVLLPHFDQEESVVFPKSRELLSTEEWATLDAEGRAS